MDVSFLVRNIFSNIEKIIKILILISVQNNVYAYPTPVDYDGRLLKWNLNFENQNVKYKVEIEEGIDDKIFVDLVDTAAHMWTEVSTSSVVLRQAEEGEMQNITIHLVTQIEGMGVSSGYAIFDRYIDTDPEHCSIYVLVGTYFSLRAIGKTILHEIGHCLGLGHSLVPEAVMSYKLEKNSFSLDLDDKAAVSRLYPLSDKKSQLPLGCSITAGGGDRKPLLNILIIFGLPTLALALRSIVNGWRASDQWKP